MLTENSRAIAVTATAEKGDYKYSVDYNLNGNKLVSLHCNIYKKTIEEVTTSTGTQQVEKEEYAGLMFQENGNKQFSFPQDTDITPHVTVFEQILVEVKASLVTDTKE